MKHGHAQLATAIGKGAVILALIGMLLILVWLEQPHTTSVLLAQTQGPIAVGYLVSYGFTISRWSRGYRVLSS